jgi:hypothetical protein
LKLVTVIEGHYPRGPYPAAYDFFLAIHRAQKDSIVQLGPDRRLGGARRRAFLDDPDDFPLTLFLPSRARAETCCDLAQKRHLPTSSGYLFPTLCRPYH